MNPSSSAAPSDRWSLASWFSAFGADDHHAARARIPQDLAAQQMAAAGAGAWSVAELARGIAEWEALSARMWHLSAWLGCLSADDAANEAVKAEEAWLALQEAELQKIRAALQRVVADLDPDAFAALREMPEMAGAGYAIERLREAGQQQMSLEMEALASDLNVDGLHAWGRLYETLTGKLDFPMTFPDGHTETVPMSRRRALMASPERAVRLAAFREGQQPWLDHADTFGAGLNGIAGARLSLCRRRGQDDFLTPPLFDARMSRASLDAMLSAIQADWEIPRRALRAAARLQGTERLHFADLEAPQVAAPAGLTISWADACRMTAQAFDASYPALGGYFHEMLRDSWIEAQPRPRKRPGAFCTGSLVAQEERVYMTYNGTIHDVVTLAHEVGHAWHSRVLRGTRLFAADYPMTLAETASNFGEMILLHGLLQGGGTSPELTAYLLDQEMNRAHSYLVNIPMRFEFEKRFYEARRSGEVPVSALRTLMEEAQQFCYGDTLETGGEDPMMWASKMHFFITGVSFYNFPYVFGYLLSQALFARFREEGPAFLPRYEAFLKSTGSASCEDVARNALGADLTDPAFWQTGIRGLVPQLESYESLAGRSR